MSILTKSLCLGDRPDCIALFYNEIYRSGGQWPKPRVGKRYVPRTKQHILFAEMRSYLILHWLETGHTTIKMTATVIYNLKSLPPDFLRDTGPSGARWDVGLNGSGFLVAPSSQDSSSAERPLIQPCLCCSSQLQEKENLPLHGPLAQVCFFLLLPNPEGYLYFLPYRVAW